MKADAARVNVPGRNVMAVLASAILHERPRHCRPSPFCPDVFAVIVNGFVNPAM